MNKQKLSYLAIALAIFVLSFLLNPSADRHRETISQAIAERSQLENVLGVGHLSAFASRYKSIGVASYTTINDEVVTIGVLGVVFFVD